MPELLAQVEDLRTRLRNPVDFDEDAAELDLRIASGEVRAATGQLFDLVLDEHVILNGTGTKTLLLPELPVLEVSELLEAFGTDDETELVGPTSSSAEWEWSEDGIIRRLGGSLFSNRYRWYRAKVSHGYDVIPDEVSGVVLRIVARTFDNPTGLKQETIGRYSYTSAGESAGIGLMPADVKALIPYTIDQLRGRNGTAAIGSGSA